jgi:hypothetical protein
VAEAPEAVIVVVAVETVLLVVLLVLVAGLLRSHAEILRRLGPEGEQQPGRATAAAPARVRAGEELRAAPLQGMTLSGDPVVLAFDGDAAAPTLLAFLSSGCTTCAGFWEALAQPRLPADVRTVIVTHGEDRERPSKLRALAPDGVPVVMSSAAWSDYAVPASPYFVLIDEFIRGEGVAATWDALSSLVSDAIEDQRAAQSEVRRDPEGILQANGIGPGHPSLRPGERAGA